MIIYKVMTGAKKQTTATELPSLVTGIGGGAYEFEVIAYFLLLMMLDAIPPIINHDTKIRKLVPQNKKMLDEEQDQENPFETDDLIIYCSNNDINCKILLSIKSNISFTQNNNDARDVIIAAYRDTQKNTFNSEYDRVVLVTTVLDGNKNGVLGIINKAKSKTSYTQAFPEYGLATIEKKALTTISEALKHEKEDVSKEEIYSFIRSFDIMILDIRDPLDQDGYSISLSMILSLIDHKRKNNDIKPIDVWTRTLSFATTIDGMSGILEKNKLPKQIEDYYHEALGIYHEEKDLNQNNSCNNYDANIDIAMLLLGRIESNNDGDLKLFEDLRSIKDEQ